MTEARPRLRALDMRWSRQGDRRILVLHDPTGVAEGAMMVPEILVPVLGLFDGTRDAAEIAEEAGRRWGLPMDAADVVAVAERLDDARFLEGPAYEAAATQALERFRGQGVRPAAHAGGAYPGGAGELTALLEGYGAENGPRPAVDLAKAGAHAATPTDHGGTRESRGGGAAGDARTGAITGLLCPHIDYARGGDVYAGVWVEVAEAARAARRVVILGTDHMGRPGSVSLTRLDFQTPLGELPCDRVVVDALAARVGEAEAFRDELHHAGEHSIELAAVWLQRARAGAPVPLVPILVGGLDGGARTEDGALEGVAEVLREVVADETTLVVAAGDLAHVGPAFGDARPLDERAKARLGDADRETLARMAEGDARGFATDVAATAERRICGLGPIYVALRALAPVAGHVTGYDQCPADPEGGSVVSVAGVVWRSAPGGTTAGRASASSRSEPTS